MRTLAFVLLVAPMTCHALAAQQHPSSQIGAFVGANYPGGPSYLPSRPWLGGSLIVRIAGPIDFYPAIEVHSKPTEGGVLRGLVAGRVRPFGNGFPLYAGAGMLVHSGDLAASYLLGIDLLSTSKLGPYFETRLRRTPTYVDLVTGLRIR